MPNPWDLPPLPIAGDPDPNLTYEAVGAMSSAWETIEFDLMRIMTIFLGDPDGEAMREYGRDGRSTKRRFTLFCESAEAHFRKSPDQEKEGNLHLLMIEAKAFVDRRNEVIHGIVTHINNIEFFRKNLENKEPSPLQYAVVPPYHMVRSHGEDGFPLYAYVSADMGKFIKRLWNLHMRLNSYRLSLLP